MLKPLSKLADTAKDDEPVMAAGDTEPQAVPAAAPADGLDELGDAVVEQAPPSLDEAPAQPAVTASAAAEAPSAPAGGQPAPEAPKADEDPLDRQFKDLAAALAEQKGIPVEEAEAMLAREARVALAQKMGVSQEQAREDDKDPQKRAAMEQAMRQAGGGGGGAFGSLVAGIGSAFAALGPEHRHARKARRDARQRENWQREWQRGFDEKVEAFCDSGDRIKSSVDEFNAAFLKTEAAARLRKMAEDQGQTLDGYMKDLSEGRVTSPEAVAAAEKAASDPAARAAYQRMDEAIKSGGNAIKEAETFQQKLLRNFPNSIDADAMNQKLESAQADFMKGMKEPIYQPSGGAEGKDKKAAEEQKKFMERIREMAESIQRMIERFLARLGLGSGPRA